MNNVKKYDIGEINIDLTKAKMNSLLPYVHYTYELPLLSFGDAHNTVSLSLIFNYENYKKDVESGTNPFSIAPGYKLNLQKSLIYHEARTLTSFQGAVGNVVDLTRNPYDVFTFDDDSQRVLRREEESSGHNPIIPPPNGFIDYEGDSPVYSHLVEYPDFSTEKYNGSGKITESFDKYGNTVLSYEYGSNTHLTSITFKSSKVINIDYASDRMKYITYGNKTIELCYNADGSLDCVKHYTGVKYQFTLSNVEFSTSVFDVMHKCNFKVEAIATESNTHLCSKELKMTDSYTVTVSDTITNNSVNSVSHRAATNLLNTNLTGKYFDVIDNNGATVRTWVEDGKKLYSYPLLDSAEQFGGYSPQFLGNVSIYNVLKPTDCYDNTLDNTLDRRISGTQAPGDGILLNYNTTNYQWSRNIGNSDGDGGYYILSGWIKSSEVSYDTIHINRSFIPIFSHTIELEPLGEWHYFCILFCAPAGEINVDASMGGLVSTRDFRITPIKTNSQANKTSNVGTTEYVLFKENAEIPFTDVSFYYTRGGADNIIDTDDEDEVATVTASDILRYKLRQKKTGVYNEVYYNDCKNVIAETTALKVLYNGNYSSISEFDVGIKEHSGNNISVTRIYANEDNQVNIVKTRTVTKKIESANGDITKSALVSSELYGSDLDLLASNVDGITTEYLRDTQGHLISEYVNGLYTRTTSYGTNDEGEPMVTVTDEFNNSTIYTFDNIWGTIKSVRLPNGIVVDNTYDENASVLTGIAFDSSAARESELGYSGGKLTSLTDGALNYSFEYSSTTRDLVGVTKNGAYVEQHTYSRNNGNTTVESKYPSADNPIRTETVVLDRYNRLKSIGNILQNTYGANEESTDSLVGEKKTYEYEKKQA